jgi:SNF family Na+-dependent transporter
MKTIIIYFYAVIAGWILGAIFIGHKCEVKKVIKTKIEYLEDNSKYLLPQPSRRCL